MCKCGIKGLDIFGALDVVQHYWSISSRWSDEKDEGVS